MKDWSEYKPSTFEYNGKWIKNWFSNMIYEPIIIGTKTYNSVENYYQAMKTTDMNMHQIIADATPSISKKLGRTVNLRPDWEEIKQNVMFEALVEKWSKPHNKERLLSTGNDIIIEWNNWGDKIWGVTINDCLGHNLLGLQLMNIRNHLRGE